jgi:hypothetical protein
MRVVIDTSSLLSLVRYYLPFDTDNILFNAFKTKFESGEIILIDKVFEECRFIAKGIVVSSLKYLDNKKIQVKTEEILPSKKFFNQLENQFINGSIRNKLSDVQFENRKNDFLESADAKLLLYCLKNKDLFEDELFLVTEETEGSNDNKSFKKLPSICKILEIEVKTLPELMKLYNDINFIIN